MNKNLGILLAVIGIFTIWFYTRHPLTAKVKIRDITYFVDVAVTDREKELGLGYRDNLGVNRGMLFAYDHNEQFSYWMKGMKFPLDIIWIRDNQIVDISKNVPISIGEYLPVYKPKSPVNKVLEINAGQADAHGFAVGDLVHILN